MSAFQTLSKIDVSEHTEKKGKFTYLSWAWAVKVLLENFPDATWEVHTYFDNGVETPYMRTQAGAFVQVTVSIDEVRRTQVHPVLDHMNKSVDEPNAFQINNSIQRCLAKAIALHGLGLYIYAGEDLPTEPEELNEKQVTELFDLLGKIDNTQLSEQIKKAVDSKEINDGNFKGAMAKLRRQHEVS
jgi:hypothetical protein|tara:strand:+ start:742 stop:1299 length:558 start_codon:yes stop_codon:yes gene_type:complete